MIWLSERLIYASGIHDLFRRKGGSVWAESLVSDCGIYKTYMKLKSAERYAIRWHMGPYSGQQDWNTLGAAMEKYPLVLALFEADMEASNILEGK